MVSIICTRTKCLEHIIFYCSWLWYKFNVNRDANNLHVNNTYHLRLICMRLCHQYHLGRLTLCDCPTADSAVCVGRLWWPWPRSRTVQTMTSTSWRRTGVMTWASATPSRRGCWRRTRRRHDRSCRRQRRRSGPDNNCHLSFFLIFDTVLLMGGLCKKWKGKSNIV